MSTLNVAGYMALDPERRAEFDDWLIQYDDTLGVLEVAIHDDLVTLVRLVQDADHRPIQAPDGYSDYPYLTESVELPLTAAPPSWWPSN